MAILNSTEFWSWAYSDFLSNTLRGVLAEFLVAKAIDTSTNTRTEWDAFDLLTECGLKIEVKSSAYLQSWEQTKPSVLRFDIAKKSKFDAANNAYEEPTARHADVYVFCVFAEKNRDIANPLDSDQWFFVVVPTSVLDENLSNQKTVGLATLERIGGKIIRYSELRDAIYGAFATANTRVASNPPDIQRSGLECR